MFKVRSRSRRSLTLGLTLLMALMVALTLSACGDDKNNTSNNNLGAGPNAATATATPKAASLVGRWQQISEDGVAGFNTQKGTIIEFFADGNADLKQYASKYVLLSPGKMTLSLGQFSEVYTYSFAEGNQLTIVRNSDNKAYKYQKAA